MSPLRIHPRFMLLSAADSESPSTSSARTTPVIRSATAIPSPVTLTSTIYCNYDPFRSRLTAITALSSCGHSDSTPRIGTVRPLAFVGRQKYGDEVEPDATLCDIIRVTRSPYHLPRINYRPDLRSSCRQFRYPPVRSIYDLLRADELYPLSCFLALRNSHLVNGRSDYPLGTRCSSRSAYL